MRRPDWWPVRAAAAWQLELDAGRVALRSGGRLVAAEACDGTATQVAAVERMLASAAGGDVAAWIDGASPRLLLLPWSEALTSRARWQTFAGSRFEQVFGEAATDWQVRVADDVSPRARLAAAVPLALVAALQRAASGRLVSLRITLLDRLSRLLAGTPRFSGCVLEVGAAAATLLVLVGGNLRRVRTRRFDAADELVATARSEWAGFGVEAPAAEIAAVVCGSAGESLAPALAAAIGAARVVEPPGYS